MDDVIKPEVVEIVGRISRFDRFRQAISRHRRGRSPIFFAGRQILPSTTKKYRKMLLKYAVLSVKTRSEVGENRFLTLVFFVEYTGRSPYAGPKPC